MGTPDPHSTPNPEELDGPTPDPARTPPPEQRRYDQESGPRIEPEYEGRIERAPERPARPIREPGAPRGEFRGYTQPGATSSKATISLVLAIIGIFILPIILSAIAIIVGWAALNDIDRNPALGGKGIAVAGIVLGVIGLIIGIIGIVVAAAYNWFIFFLY